MLPDEIFYWGFCFLNRAFLEYMREKQKMHQLFIQFINYAWYAHHVTKHNTLIHNILSTAPQLSISQKALGTLPEDGNVMSKHVGNTVHN
jgi:hypothetical protein